MGLLPSSSPMSTLWVRRAAGTFDEILFSGAAGIDVEIGDESVCILNIHGVASHTHVVDMRTPKPRLTRLELRIMEVLWTRGASSIREIQETFPVKDRPAYTTIQTIVYRLEGKKALRRVKKVGNFHIFEAVVSRDAAHRRLIDDLLAICGGRAQPVMARLIESGKLTLADVKQAEKTLQALARKHPSK